MTPQAPPSGRFLGRPEKAYPGYVPPAVARREKARPGERSRSGRLWMVQALTGAVLIVALGVHLFAQHLIAPGGLRDYASVVEYLRHPVALAIEVVLLISVIVHAGLGMRSSLVDVLSEDSLRRASVVIAIASVLAIGYGVWLTAILVGASL